MLRVGQIHKLLVGLLIAYCGLASAAVAIDPVQQQRQPRRAAEQTSAPTPASPQRPTTSTTPATAGSWLIEYTDTAAWFADQTQIERQGSMVRAWHTMVYATPSSGVAYIVALEEYDCNGRRARPLAGAAYSSSGQVVDSVEPTQFTYVIPGSVHEALLIAFCADFALWETDLPTARVPPGLTVHQAAANLFRATQQPAEMRLTPQLLYGRWTRGTGCSSAMTFYESGRYRSESGEWGIWVIAGDLFFLDGNRFTAVVADQRRFRLTASNGAVTNFTRCL